MNFGGFLLLAPPSGSRVADSNNTCTCQQVPVAPVVLITLYT